MKPYTGTIVDTLFENGVLRVKVQYSNGEDTFNDTIETSQLQDPSWAETQIRKRLVHLNTLPELAASIEKGKEITHESSDVAAAPGAPEPGSLEEYRADLFRFERYVAAIAKGITTEEQEDFIQLKAKLAANFKPEYVDLF